MNYSIWLVPPEPVFSQVQTIIDALAVEYKSFSFQPHITVEGMIDQDLDWIVSKVREVTKFTKPLNLSTGPVSFSTTFYASVFIRVNSSAPLMNLNLDLKRVLGREEKAYMPHISLIYGNHDMETREKIVRETKISPLTFTAKQIEIIPEKPEAREWKPVAVIQL